MPEFANQWMGFGNVYEAERASERIILQLCCAYISGNTRCHNGSGQKIVQVLHRRNEMSLYPFQAAKLRLVANTGFTVRVEYRVQCRAEFDFESEWLRR